MTGALITSLSGASTDRSAAITFERRSRIGDDPEAAVASRTSTELATLPPPSPDRVADARLGLGEDRLLADQAADEAGSRLEGSRARWPGLRASDGRGSSGRGSAVPPAARAAAARPRPGSRSRGRPPRRGPRIQWASPTASRGARTSRPRRAGRSPWPRSTSSTAPRRTTLIRSCGFPPCGDDRRTGREELHLDPPGQILERRLVELAERLERPEKLSDVVHAGQAYAAPVRLPPLMSSTRGRSRSRLWASSRRSSARSAGTSSASRRSPTWCCRRSGSSAESAPASTIVGARRRGAGCWRGRCSGPESWSRTRSTAPRRKPTARAADPAYRPHHGPRGPVRRRRRLAPRQDRERQRALIHSNPTPAPEIPDLDVTSFVLERAAERRDAPR